MVIVVPVTRRFHKKPQQTEFNQPKMADGKTCACSQPKCGIQKQYKDNYSTDTIGNTLQTITSDVSRFF